MYESELTCMRGAVGTALQLAVDDCDLTSGSGWPHTSTQLKCNHAEEQDGGPCITRCTRTCMYTAVGTAIDVARTPPVGRHRPLCVVHGGIFASTLVVALHTVHAAAAAAVAAAARLRDARFRRGGR